MTLNFLGGVQGNNLFTVRNMWYTYWPPGFKEFMRSLCSHHNYASFLFYVAIHNISDTMADHFLYIRCICWERTCQETISNKSVPINMATYDEALILHDSSNSRHWV